MIDILSSGTIFGEIGVLTKLRRTTTVIARETCIFQTLHYETVNLIKQKYPEIFNRMYEGMANYEDEEMFQRRQFVQNIPYFRNLDHKHLAKIVLMMRPKMYEYGDLIIGAGENHACIFIVWKGFV